MRNFIKLALFCIVMGVEDIFELPNDFRDLSREKLIGLLTETDKERQKLAADIETLKPYVGEQALEHILSGERPDIVRATMLFLDIEGFTALSDEVDKGKGDAEKLAEETMTPISQIAEDIFQTKYSGHVNKFIGDAVLATFGSPGYTPNQEEAAIKAALEFQHRLAVYTTKHGLDLRARIGIKTGYVLSGAIGSSKRKQVDVLGNNVNLSQRIEDQVKNVDTQTGILIDEETYLLTKDLFDFKAHDPFMPKGKKDKLKIFEPLRPRPRGTIIRKREQTKLYEREDEVALLEKLKQDLSRFQLIAIMGEIGTGKSELVRQTLLSDPNYYSVSSFCNPLEQSSSFSTVTDITKKILGTNPADIRSQLSKLGLENYLSVYANLTDMSLNSKNLSGSPEDLKAQIKEFFVDLIVAKSRDTKKTGLSGLILHLDDADNIDTGSREALDLLLSSSQNEPLLVALTSQPNYDLPYSREAQKISINYLQKPESTSEFARDILGELIYNKISPLLLQSLHRITSGDPIFIAEISKQIKQEHDKNVTPPNKRGFNAKVDRILTAYDATDSSDLPDRVADAIVTRAKSLGEGVLHTLQLLSISGKFGYELDLRQQLGFEPDYDLLKREGFLSPNAKNLEFAHDKYRRAFYQCLGPIERKRRHARLAEIIIQHNTTNGEVDTNVVHKIAYHYNLSDERDKAISYFELAAKRSASLFGNEDVIGHNLSIFNIITSILPQQEIKSRLEQRIQNLFNIGNTHLFGTSNYEAAIQVFQDTIDIAEDIINKSNQFIMRASNGMGLAYIRLKRYDNAENTLNRAKGIATMYQDRKLADILLNFGALHLDREESQRINRGAYLPSLAPDTTDLEEAEFCFQEAITVAKLHGLQTIQPKAFYNLAIVSYRGGDVDKALEYCEQAKNEYEKLHWSLSLVRVESLQGSIYRWQALLNGLKDENKPDSLELVSESLKHHLKAYSLAQEVNNCRQMAFQAAEIARDYALLDDLDEAKRYLAYASSHNTLLKDKGIYSKLDDLLHDFIELRKK
jgi:class 3 adenylate cyclase/tetratricopeptide (TPR) repeat protein